MSFGEGMLVWFGALSFVLVASWLIANGIAWVPTPRGRARRQLDAIELWANGQPLCLRHIRDRARGYYAARDWLGVEAAYLHARRVIDNNEE